ncbi:MAG TPA: protein translocase subunit SecF [Patescibacteria group bacterium]|nr:protein translocase subunit SecF [Patescibacteria group bacterium]
MSVISSFPFVRLRRVWFAFSAMLILASLVVLAVFGLRFSIDFTGGSLLEVRFSDEVPSTQEIGTRASEAGYAAATVQTAGVGKAILRLPTLSEEQHQALLGSLQQAYSGLTEERFDSIGPAISGELRRSAFIGVGVTLFLIGSYIAWAFRKVSEPVKSWKYGILTVLCALHDVVVPLGAFALLGAFFHWEVGTAFIAALLTILGYSISDTVVVFDRTRENLLHHPEGTFGDVVERSIRQTFVRSLNTSLTTLLALAAIAVWGGESTRPFAVALGIGILIGTYSSIFIASPLLVSWEEWRRKRRVA